MGTTADANRSSLRYQKETAWGVTPGTPALKALRFTGDTLAHDKTTITSAEIRDDRQVSDLAEVGAQAMGQIQIELSFAEYQDLLAAALFCTPTVLAFNDSATITASSQTLTGSAGDFSNAQPGCFVRVGGSTTPLNNGLKRIVSKAGDGSSLVFAAGSFTADQSPATLTVNGTHLVNGKEEVSFYAERALPVGGSTSYQRFSGLMVDKLGLTVETKQIIKGTVDFLGRQGDTSSASLMALTGTKAVGTLTLSGNAVADETVTIAGKTYTWKGSVGATANQVLVGGSASASLDNLIAAINGAAGSGTTYGSATVAHTLVDAAAGAGDTMTVTAKANGTAGNAYATTETMTNGAFGGAVLAGGVDDTAVTASSTNPVMNGTSNVGSLTMDNAALTQHFKQVVLNIANNLRGKDEIGNKGNFELGVGQFALTGSFNAYFKDNTLLAAFIAHDYTQFAFSVTDSDGNTIAFNVPKMNFSKGNPAVQGINTDVMQALEFQAIMDDVLGCTFTVSFVPAA